MDKLLSLTIGTAVLLAACSLQSAIKSNDACYKKTSSSWAVCDLERGYTFMYPAWIEEGTKVDNPVEVYTYDFATCPLTPRHMEEVQQSNGITWGKVDYKPSDDPAPGENDVFCPPLKPATAAYAFCAEKDGKAVAICIQQVTDNFELAKGIFETFRWTP